MDDMDLLIDLHINNARQGPGGPSATRRAIDIAGLQNQSNLTIADIGCGTGASALMLASELDCHVTAVDFLPAFLERLQSRAIQQGCDDRITTLAASMDSLPFDDGSLDVIWSEGAIYNIGFEEVLKACQRLLNPGGIIAVSEISWLTRQPAAELADHWNAIYPEIAPVSTKLAQMEEHGYSPLGCFVLSPRCWLQNYYQPLQDRFPHFLDKHEHSQAAQRIVAEEQAEIALYETYQDQVSYGFYIARKTEI
ncbi:MAG: class I SAM-dependent methyltransferase [Alphaproteobacteria bacterium]